MNNIVHLYIKSSSDGSVLYQAETDNVSFAQTSEAILTKYENNLYNNKKDTDNVLCVHLIQSSNGGVVLERGVIQRIASLGLKLCFFVHFKTVERVLHRV